MFSLVNRPRSALSQEMEEELNLKVDANEFRLLKSLSNDDGQVISLMEGGKKVQNVN